MLINFYVFLTVIFLFVGLATDVGAVQLRKLALQHAADAAALGALYEKSRALSDWVAAGKTDAALNGFTDGSDGVTINIVSPPTSGSYAGDSTAIQATITQTYHTSFLGILGSQGNATPIARAVSKLWSNPDCIYLTGGGSFYYPLSNALGGGFYSSCNMYIASPTHAVYDDLWSVTSFTNSAIIKSAGSPSSLISWIFGAVSPVPTYNSSTESDPLAYETAPALSSCTNNLTSVLYTTAVLSPGTYCGGLTIGFSTVTFNPGLYVITGGLNWYSSTVNGSGVTFYLTQGGGWLFNTFNILNSTVTLSAPVSSSAGALAGIVVFGDRNWSLDGIAGVFLTGSHVSTNGIWYVPNTGIINASSTLTASQYLGIVTNNIEIAGGTFVFPSPDYTSISGGNPFRRSSAGSIVE